MSAKYLFNGLDNDLGRLATLSDAKTRSVCPENFTGDKGAAAMAEKGNGAHASRELGKGWKVSPSRSIAPHEEFVLADITGPGCIEHIWLTYSGIPSRFAIIRMFWDDSEVPSVECPLGDFFANAYAPNNYRSLSSLAVCLNPRNGMNCYWQMPFRKRARITLENIADDPMNVYYQIDYTLTEIPDDHGYFHAQFRRTNPLAYEDVYTILENVEGKGQYVGTYMAWGVNNNGWWGEGEIKLYLDGDGEFPTIAGTGTEDYFCGAYDFDVDKRYEEFCTPYSGMATWLPDGLYKSQHRFSMYRWHITDPIRFDSDIKVTMQALGWRTRSKNAGRKYLPLQDDISSVAFFYLDKPCQTMPQLPDRDYLEII